MNDDDLLVVHCEEGKEEEARKLRDQIYEVYSQIGLVCGVIVVTKGLNVSLMNKAIQPEVQEVLFPFLDGPSGSEDS
jgi:hypothetical protein